ncbi:hypothetical protein CEXT_245241 [Caerostris extrusa]|uniref:Uncharacterized protein n=1 Tax=Caerostris extrusa TaxID=172846 RepID=A0AAV4QCK4_CAEEX|nr:hypothetical protein CEXT_245241 [Caerostris extrusa]
MHSLPCFSSNDLHFRTLSFKPKPPQKSETIANCLATPQRLSAKTILSSAKARQFLGRPEENDTITTILQVTYQRIDRYFKQLGASWVALHNTSFEVNWLGVFTPYLEASVCVRIEVPEDFNVSITRTQAVQNSEYVLMSNRVGRSQVRRSSSHHSGCSLH